MQPGKRCDDYSGRVKTGLPYLRSGHAVKRRLKMPIWVRDRVAGDPIYANAFLPQYFN